MQLQQPLGTAHASSSFSSSSSSSSPPPLSLLPLHHLPCSRSLSLQTCTSPCLELAVRAHLSLKRSPPLVSPRPELELARPRLQPSFFLLVSSQPHPCSLRTTIELRHASTRARTQAGRQASVASNQAYIAWPWRRLASDQSTRRPDDDAGPEGCRKLPIVQPRYSCLSTLPVLKICRQAHLEFQEHCGQSP